MELSVLCDIKACVVFLGPNGQVETWPENPDSVREIINKYQDFSAKNGCMIKKVKVEEPDDDDAPEITMIKEGFGTKKDFIKQEPAWDDDLSKASAQEFLENIDQKLETMQKRTDLLNKSKGKEVAVSVGEGAELNQGYFTYLRNMLEEEETLDLQGTQVPPQAEATADQTIPCLQTMPQNNLFETPQFFNSSDNSWMGFLEETSTDQQTVQNIPQQLNFNSSTTNNGINFFAGTSNLEQNIQFPDQSFGYDNSSHMLGVMPLPTGLSPQLPDGMNFSGGTLMQPTMLAPNWFDEGAAFNAGQTIYGSQPQLYPQLFCPLPQQAFVPDFHSWQPPIHQLPPPSSSFQRLNMQYQGF